MPDTSVIILLIYTCTALRTSMMTCCCYDIARMGCEKWVYDPATTSRSSDAAAGPHRSDFGHLGVVSHKILLHTTLDLEEKQQK